MKTILTTLFRLLISIVAGFLAGLFCLLVFSLAMLFGQTIYVSLMNPAVGINPIQGGLKSVVIEYPLVVFGLPLLDTGLCPGLLAGVVARRLRSFRALAIAGCACGLVFSGVVYLTYAIFDPILAAGFVVLEIVIAWIVSRVDERMEKGFEISKIAGICLKRESWKKIGIFFPVIVIGAMVGLKTCCTFPLLDSDEEKTVAKTFRSIPPGESMNLFNGRDFSGWIVQGFGKWAFEEGAVIPRRGSGYLATRYEVFSDFILDADIRVNKRGNSGIFFRAYHPPFGLRSQPVGYEAQIDHDDPKNPTGSLYKRMKADPVLSRDGEWFHMTVSAIGERIQIQVNGETVVDATDSTFQKGFIALQSHDPYSEVAYKNLRIKIPVKD